MILFTGLDEFNCENLTWKKSVEESNNSFINGLIKLCNGLYMKINNEQTDANQKAEIRRNILEMMYAIAKRGREHCMIDSEAKLRKIELEREEEMNKIDELKRECDKKIDKIRTESDPAVQEIKKKWYQHFGHRIAKLFKKQK
jgi:hypothetical protein